MHPIPDGIFILTQAHTWGLVPPRILPCPAEQEQAQLCPPCPGSPICTPAAVRNPCVPVTAAPFPGAPPNRDPNESPSSPAQHGIAPVELGQHRQHLTLPLRNKPLRLWFALLLLGTQEGQPGMAVALNPLHSADSSAPSWVMPVPCLGPCKPLSERGHFSVAVTAALPWGRA